MGKPPDLPSTAEERLAQSPYAKTKKKGKIQVRHAFHRGKESDEESDFFLAGGQAAQQE